MLKILGISYGMGDDHDGNIMVSKKKDVVFIDVGRLSWGAKI
jgi:predicted unusual protein kinase regulating ubiquinone biosynthesis (AarF/ABC1/UbiB family)